MQEYKIEVSLISELTNYSPMQNESISDPVQFFHYRFYNDGGIGIRAYPISPCIKPEAVFVPNETIFSNLEWNLESDPVVAENTNESYENLSFTGSQSAGWDFTYSVVNTFEIYVAANKFAVAEQIIRNSVSKYLEIFDSGVEEILDIEKVRLLNLN